MDNKDIPCKEHPDAPHGFMRDASHSAGRYVCECESWEPPKREWVGLTDAEKEKLVEAFYGTDIQRLEAVEARLKEKNGL